MNPNLLLMIFTVKIQVVIAEPALHWQTLAGPQYDGSLSGQWRRPSTHLRRLPMDERKVIAHRAMLEIDRPHAIINLGIGMPEVLFALWRWWASLPCDVCRPQLRHAVARSA